MSAARWGDVVFNEVMADPNPPVDFDREYLELYNRSGQMWDLEGWVLHVNDRVYTLSGTHLEAGTLLSPGSFAVLHSVTLPNNGATLALFTPTGEVVHAARYRIPWDGEAWKKEGGWSLESPDTDQICTISDLWEFSGDPAGGTPGMVNSNSRRVEDVEPPVLLYSGFADPADAELGREQEGDRAWEQGGGRSGDQAGLLRIFFSEPVVMDPEELGLVVMQPGNVLPLEACFPGPLTDILELRFPADLQERLHFNVDIPRVRDCSGNESRGLQAKAGRVSEPAFGSVLINEIMFDPEEGKPEYIELTKAGQQYYDLRELAIHVTERGGMPDDPVPLSDHSRLMVPGTFLVLSACTEQLREAYRLERSGLWAEVEGLKAMNNHQGTLFLTDRAGNVVDRVDYGEEMHAAILSDTRGISLERISEERSGSDPDNWHSAAAIAGYATPGRINSQAMTATESDLLFQVEPQVFSPDNDGYEDLLEILVSNGSQGWVLSLWITDLQGHLLRRLANNHLCGPQARYTWDGTREDGGMLLPGIYVIHATGYHPATGGRWIRKRAAGLVYR